MKAITNIFATQPSGNVPASYLDVDFALIADANTFSNYFVDTGAANAYVVTFAAGTTGSLTAGLPIQFLVGASNTGASTLTVNAMTPKNITNWDGSALIAGQLKAGTVVSVIYDGTQYKLTGAPNSASMPMIAGTITTSQPALPITQTWNAGGVTFDAQTITITDTASAAASRFVNYLIGASSKYSVDKTGMVTAAGGFTGTLLTAAQPNVTSVGTLTSLTSSGAISGTTLAFGTGGNVNTTGLKFLRPTDTGLGAGFNGYGSMWPENVTPSATNYSLLVKYDASLVYLNAATGTVALTIGATPIATATSTGLAVTGTLNPSSDIFAATGMWNNSTTSSVKIDAAARVAGITNTATTFYTLPSASYLGLVVLTGDGTGGGFVDFVTVLSGTITAQASYTIYGTPAVRTYSAVGTAMKVSFAAGTYRVSALPFVSP